MNMKLKTKVILLSAVATLLLGVLWHFVYDWTGQNRFIGLIFPTNESTWEHMKLVFFPMSISAIYMYKNLKEEYPTILSHILCSIVLGTWFVPILFYSYSGIYGRTCFVADIIVFLLSVLFAHLALWHYAGMPWPNVCFYFGVILYMLQLISFFWFTYHPGTWNIFTDLS